MPLEVAKLRELAKVTRNLAATAHDEHTRKAFIELADEYDERADARDWKLRYGAINPEAKSTDDK